VESAKLDAVGLRAVLESVGAAITVRGGDGRMLYANQAAADLLGVSDRDAILREAPGGIMELFDIYTEAGRRMSLEDLPVSQALAGNPAPRSIVVRNVVRATGVERWLINKARPVRDAAGVVVMVVNVFEDITGTKRAEIAQRLLAQASREMAELDDPTGALQGLAETAVPDLADWAGIDVLDDAGRIVPVALAHLDPEKVRLGWRLRREWPAAPDESRGLGRVIRTGKAQLISEITDEMLRLGAVNSEHLALLRAVGLNSTMIAPIRAGERVLGALSFVSSTSRRFDERDLALASDLGRQVGTLMRSAQLRAEQARIAHTLQAGLIPRVLPEVEGWSMTSAYRAAGRANEVGGDFYDVVRSPTGWAAIIGDVLGKGAAAASLTALARHTIAAIIESTGDVPHALRVLNRRLREREGMFRSLCTLAVIEVSHLSEVTVHLAGHPPPLLVGPDGVREIGQPSPMLGFIGDLEILPVRACVRPGETVVLYTDGVLDAMGESGRLGESGLIDTVAQAGTDVTADALLAAIDSFQSGEQSDDIAIVSLARLPVPAAAPS
jgi:PAS domain S-box-containing protein